MATDGEQTTVIRVREVSTTKIQQHVSLAKTAIPQTPPVHILAMSASTIPLYALIPKWTVELMANVNC